MCSTVGFRQPNILLLRLLIDAYQEECPHVAFRHLRTLSVPRSVRPGRRGPHVQPDLRLYGLHQPDVLDWGGPPCGFFTCGVSPVAARACLTTARYTDCTVQQFSICGTTPGGGCGATCSDCTVSSSRSSPPPPFASHPDPNAPVLIYCNNNFTRAERAFSGKASTASLNLSTFIAIYNGYRNVYELGLLVDIGKSKLPFEGSEDH